MASFTLKICELAAYQSQLEASHPGSQCADHMNAPIHCIRTSPSKLAGSISAGHRSASSIIAITAVYVNSIIYIYHIAY